MTLFEIADALYQFNLHEPNVERISPQHALCAAVESVIDGDRNIDDTIDRAASLSETNNVSYTTTGYEYDAATLYDALNYIRANQFPSYFYPRKA